MSAHVRIPQLCCETGLFSAFETNPFICLHPTRQALHIFLVCYNVVGAQMKCELLFVQKAGSNHIQLYLGAYLDIYVKASLWHPIMFVAHCILAYKVNGFSFCKSCWVMKRYNFKTSFSHKCKYNRKCFCPYTENNNPLIPKTMLFIRLLNVLAKNVQFH